MFKGICVPFILVTLAASAPDCDAPDCDANALLQSKVMIVDEGAAGLDFSEASINKRHAARARLVIEADLATFDESHYRNFNHAESLEVNIQQAFDDFMSTSGLDSELTQEEREDFFERFKEELEQLLKDGDFQRWRERVAAALQDEKPAMSQALIQSINSAHLGFQVTIQAWMENISNADYQAKLGTQTPQGESLMQVGNTRQFNDLLSVNVPASVDGRQQFATCGDTIGRIHNQGRCGSCWAFGALSAFDSRLCIKTNGTFQGQRAMLSRGYVTSCTYDRDGCQGGWMSSAYNIYKTSQNAGVSGGDSGCSPYFGHGDGTEHFNGGDPAPPCPTQCHTDFTQRALSQDRYVFPDMSFQNVFYSDTNKKQYLKATLYQDGPVSYAMKADSGFMSYSGGVYNNNCVNDANHAVTAIGYGTGDGVEYVHSLNSWGSGWGDGGKFKLVMCSVYAITLFNFNTNENLPNPLVPAAAPPAPTPAPWAGSWILGQEAQSCTAACTAVGKTCDEIELQTVNQASEVSAAAGAAGQTCSATVGWAYDFSPSICTNAGCCGSSGSCRGACTFGMTSARSCGVGSGGHHSRLCPCSDSGQPTVAPTQGPTNAPTDAPTAAPTPAPTPCTAVWCKVSGPCTQESSGCITSPNYPEQYGNNEHCSFSVQTGSTTAIEVEDFSVEANYDKLTVNGEIHYISEDVHGKTPAGEITWVSDGSVTKSGWKLCPRSSEPEPTPEPTQAPGPTPAPPTPAPPTPAPPTPAPPTSAPPTSAPPPAPTSGPSPAVPVTKEGLRAAIESLTADDAAMQHIMDAIRAATQ